MVVKWCCFAWLSNTDFKRQKKRLNWLHLQVWAALCYGPRWATAKGGSENLCVNTWHRLQKCTEVCTLTFLPIGVLIWRAHLDPCECYVFFFFLRCQKSLSWHLFFGCTWVYVGGSTHWVGLHSAMTHPPLHRPDRIQHTNTLDSVHLRILSINTKEQKQVMFLAFRGL